METHSWWTTLPLRIDPVFFSLGGFQVRWYGLMYLAAFFTCYKVIWGVIKRDRLPVTKIQMESFTTWIIAGILIGARLGYVLFYNFSYYAQHPLEAILPFSFSGGFRFTGISGMSYHGGLIGAFLTGTYFVRREKLNYWMMNNLTFLAVPLGYTWGRLGNFLNGELWGRETTAAIGMIFPSDKLGLIRHPSQLYEAFFEGVFLFALLYWAYVKPPMRKFMMAGYLFGYGFFRFFIEYLREPDAHIGLNTLGLSRGQILCAAMMFAGIAIGYWRWKKAVK